MDHEWLVVRIEDGLVVNAIVYDGQSHYDPGDGLRLVPRGDSGAWHGWTYDAAAETFTPPEEPAE